MRRKKKRSRKILWIVGICFIVGGILIAAGLVQGMREGKETAGGIMGKIPYAAVNVDEKSLANKFYYQQLSEKEKIPYKEILQGIRDNAKEIYLHEGNAQRTNELFQYVLDDFPEIFWCDGNATSTEYQGVLGAEGYTVLNPKYTYSGEEKEAKIQQVEAAAAECIAGAPADGTEYEKIKYVYEYLINTVDYQMGVPDNQNIISSLVNKTSVCAGYARGTQYLLEKMGIYNIYVIGTATDLNGSTEDHAWNLVRCDEKYYYVDTTWGDPVFQQDFEQGIEHAMTYDYLCCSAEEIKKTHSPAGNFAFPECNSGDLNYYKLNGMYYESCDKNELLGAIYRSIENQTPSTVFKFANDDLYNQAHDLIVNDLVQQGAQYLGSMYGLEEIPYSYEEDQVLDKITLYWIYEN